MSELTRVGRVTSWALQIAAAAILGQTLFFKLTAAPESVFIFSTLGLEPGGRIVSRSPSWCHSLPGCLATPPVGVFHYQTSPGQSHARCLGHCYRYCYIAGLQLVKVIHGDNGILADESYEAFLEAGDVPLTGRRGGA